MKAPLSWIKDFVEVTLPPKQLGEKLTEVGLGTEKIVEDGDDTILELEITPNRPDCLSIIGIAREIAAIEGKKVHFKIPEIKTPTTKLPITLKPDFSLFERWTGVIIKNVTIEDSPKWMQDRLKKVGLRPINNIVDITNYVMFELGIPLHAFDYNQIKNHEMILEKTKGGEQFTSVDEKSYRLPNDAIIIRDSLRIIDLAGIKGGLNTGIKTATKNLFLHAPVPNPVLVRRTSQALSLRSDASAIYERGTNKGGTVDTLKRAASLIVELAKGEIASDILDLKKESFEPWKLTLRMSRLHQILGVNLPEKEIFDLLDRLVLSPQKKGTDIIECTIPTYRNDLKIEEDLIEEVARLYGYNNFPKTLPSGQIPTKQIPYFKDYNLDRNIKEVLVGSGFSDVYTYGLISENDLEALQQNPEKALRVDNPVSREFEYLRPSIKMNLIKALSENQANFEDVNLFEIGKVYHGPNVSDAKEEYVLSGITNSKSFYQIKGILELLFEKLGLSKDPSDYIEVIDQGVFFEAPIEELLKTAKKDHVFVPIPKYPAVIEDLAITLKEKIKVGEVITVIKNQSQLIKDVSLLDQYKDSKTFHIVYQHKEKNLTSEDVAKIREKVITVLKEKFSAKVKE